MREVTWYAYPNPTDYGLNFTAVTAANNDATWCPGTPQGIPFTASLTAAGQAAFGYLRPDVALSIEGPCACTATWGSRRRGRMRRRCW